MTKNMTSFKVSSRLLAEVGMAAAAVLIMAAPVAFAKADTLNRQLELGMSGSDVGSLQTYLAQDSTIYPQGLVTNYFGSLTKSAVSNFQSRNGLDTVGRVGPLTLALLNARMGGTSDLTEGAGKVTNYGPLQPSMWNIAVTAGNTGATVTWTSSVPATAKVYYSTQWPFNYRTALSSTNNAAPSTVQNVSLVNLQSNTTYYYVVESLDSQGNFSWSANGPTFRTQ